MNFYLSEYVVSVIHLSIVMIIYGCFSFCSEIEDKEEYEEEAEEEKKHPKDAKGHAHDHEHHHHHHELHGPSQHSHKDHPHVEDSKHQMCVDLITTYKIILKNRRQQDIQYV